MKQWASRAGIVVAALRRVNRAVWVAVGGVAALVVIAWLWKRGPSLAADTGAALSAPDQVRALQSYHTTLIQGAIGVGGVIALAYTARNYRLARRGQTNDRFTNALERLGSSDMYVRVGGVYALAQVLCDSPEHHIDVVNVLVEFIRARTRLSIPTHVRRDSTAYHGTYAIALTALPDSIDHPAEPDPDIHAALNVLGRLPRPGRPTTSLNFSSLHLAGAWLDGANLVNSWLDEVTLTGARLMRANLTHAQLFKANLTYARLVGANLSDARLVRANLTGAWLVGANLTNARLLGANLARAWLDEARVTAKQLNQARNVDRAVLPDHLVWDPGLKRVREATAEDAAARAKQRRRRPEHEA